MRVRLLCISLLFVLNAAPAAAQRTLVIQSFHAAIDVAADGSITVEEVIVPRFSGAWTGIYRMIPVQYRTPQGLNFTLRVTIDSVTDDAGNELEYESSHERHYRKLKIWVPDAVDAAKTVRLRYRVTNALRFFEEHDELYWNVTGDEWEVPIQRATAIVRLPDGVSGVRSTAYRGAFGSTQTAASTIVPEGVRFEAIGGLGFREGLTAVVGWNPGVVHRPTVLERIAGTLYSNSPLALPPIVFVIMFTLWWASGRDPKVGTVVAQYEPPDGMTPAELGTLIDGKFDMRDIIATIVDLAVRGFLVIEENAVDLSLGSASATVFNFRLTSVREDWQTLRPHERQLLDAMFGPLDQSVSLLGLHGKFYKHLPPLRDGLYGGLVRAGLYKSRPDRVRKLYAVVGAAGGVLFAYASYSWLLNWGMQPEIGIAAGILSGVIVMAFGLIMPARTIRGTRALEKVLGLQEFLSRVEADRMDRMIRTPELFEKLLPSAMALGVSENWTRAFAGICTKPPQWYVGPAYVRLDGWDTSTFSSRLGYMSSEASKALASSPRSSAGSGFGSGSFDSSSGSGGGGHSGGGFGGGGGGGF